MAGTFSYAGTAAGTITSARDKVRLEIGDTDSSAVLFYDEEIDVYLSSRSNSVLLTAADLCDAAATKYARAYDFGTDGQSFKRAIMVKAFQARAQELRSRAGGVTTVDITRVDGYSDDIANQDVSGGTANPRQLFRRGPNPDQLP